MCVVSGRSIARKGPTKSTEEVDENRSVNVDMASGKKICAVILQKFLAISFLEMKQYAALFFAMILSIQ